MRFNLRLIEPASASLTPALVAVDSFAPSPLIVYPWNALYGNSSPVDHAQRLANGTGAQVLLIRAMESLLESKDVLKVLHDLRERDLSHSPQDLRKLGAFGVGQDGWMLLKALLEFKEPFHGMVLVDPPVTKFQNLKNLSHLPLQIHIQGDLSDWPDSSWQELLSRKKPDERVFTYPKPSLIASHPPDSNQSQTVWKRIFDFFREHLKEI